MITYMFRRIVITNRYLCKLSLGEQIKKVCREKTADTVILREKDLSDTEYLELAREIKGICDINNIEFICNSNFDASVKLGVGLQLSYQNFAGLVPDVNHDILVSVHSLAEAMNAEKLGANGIIAGHIFETDCKKGLAPRGIDFLKEICDSVNIPVFAIGGINESNLPDIKRAGASGACLMSWYMHY